MDNGWSSKRVLGIKPSEIREVLAKIEYAQDRGVKIINFSIGRPDFDTPKHIKEAAKNALDQGLVHYTISAGTAELREAVCKRLQDDFCLDVGPEEVIITNGATEAIYIGMQSILNPGDEVLVPEPMYVYYNGWSFLGGAKCVSIPLKQSENFCLKAKNIRKYLTEKSKVLILNTPNNPTGQVYEKKEILKIAQLAVKHNFIVISDDIYNRMLYDECEYFPIANAPEMKERTLIVGSFSKVYAMDGWRIGYLIAPKQIISDALKMHQHIVSCPNTFVQVGAKVALTDSQDCVLLMMAEFDRRRRLLIDYLDEIGMLYTRPLGAFYAFPSIKRFEMSSKQFADFLLDKARVAVIPGDAFGPSGEGHVRIAYSTSYEEIEKGMERVWRAVKEL